MAKMNWERLKRYSKRCVTEEDIARKQRLRIEKEKLKAARKKNKPVKKPGSATPKQMRFLRKHKLIKPTTKQVSFGTASRLIDIFIKKQKKRVS